MTENTHQPAESTFEKRLWGRFSGVLRWADLDSLWGRILADPAGWYLYVVGQEAPGETIAPPDLDARLREIDRILRDKHKHDYCGIVYVDEPASPGMVKIYDPENLGVVCGPGGERILPRWILSREKPRALDEYGAGKAEKDTSLFGSNAWWRRIYALKKPGA
uniref:Uncharacterized protein n=1 Tax=Candidatus Kentrum sp. DK TaxID=2126562 RepID=A0A450RZL5_9GAMM|nr:MAG: hypothetical protein BECKDK2373B_GA0170837_10085 [Candidatus Kentron sp. DK]VFJ61330.1 MAG: hypothetical protein BECKDK2373C_GA0170839_10887 [Candidatus Kentron sp. DK]